MNIVKDSNNIIIKKDGLFSSVFKLIRGIVRAKQICFIGKNVKIGKNVRFYPMSFVEDNVVIGDNMFIGYGCIIRESVVFGDDCSVGHFTVFEKSAIVGDRVGIHSQCHICQGTVIEDDVFIAPMYVGTNTTEIDHGRGLSPVVNGPLIKKAARIGASVTIVPGVVVGENAFIGAGSLVAKNVPDGEVWFGNPAKKHRKVSDEYVL